MPNTIVPANGEALPKIAFDRAAIMNEAHRYARMYAGREWSYTKLLSWGLKAAWKEAKEGKTAAQRRADAIRAEIDALQYKTLRYDTVAMRRHLETELAALAA
ncbi:MAG: hypothetical protein J0I98_05015 [Mesorhizobium sp.]|nr:hypothetical protein [Mesorhizobium sp.]MBN9242134.1 hypothetical protein [Mesorhizobium sp.]